LGKENGHKPQPKGIRTERFAEIAGNARAEEIGQRGEEQVERASKAEEVSQFTISE
jgi:hypothetical protein